MRLAAPSAARYDAATGTLLVPSFLPLGSQRAELAHEIAHAVADQHFGLRRFLRLAPDRGPRLDGDATRARLALVEGDAVLAGFELADPARIFWALMRCTRSPSSCERRRRASTEDPSPRSP